VSHEVTISGLPVARFSRAGIEEFTTAVLDALLALRAATRNENVSIVFVDDAAMRNLNRRYRKRNKTTDVLTFEADASHAEPGSKQKSIGEIVISIDQAKRQATEQRHSLATEIRYLITHGLIHAHGYDHEHDDGQMSRLEMKVRGRVGLE